MRKLIQTPAVADARQAPASSPLGKNKAHESAERQVSGQARYVDDMPEPANTAYAAIGVSNCAAGEIEHIDLHFQLLDR